MINTTKLENVKFTEKFYKDYNIYSISINGFNKNEIKELYSYINNYKSILSSYRKNNVIFILKQGNKKINNNNYIFTREKIKQVEMYILLNLLIKAIPLIYSQNTVFSIADNLSYFYKVKEKKVKEFICYEISISKNLNIDISSVTYSDKEGLYKALKNDAKRLATFKSKTIFFENMGKIIKYTTFKDEKFIEKTETLKELVKMKCPGSSKNMGTAVSVSTNKFTTTKNACLAELVLILDKMNDLITYNFEIVNGKFITRDSLSDNISRLETVLKDDSEIKKFFDGKSIGIIDYVQDKNVPNVKNIKEIIKSLGFFNTKVYTKYNLDPNIDYFIILTKDKNFYINNSIQDPYINYHALNTQFINIKDEPKSKSPIVDYVVLTVLKELILKDNIKNNKISYYQENINSSLIKCSFEKIGDQNLLDINNFGVIIENNNLNFFKYKEEQIIKLIGKEKFNNLKDNETYFYILSYGNATSNDYLFDNICLITEKEEHPLPPILQLKNEFDKQIVKSSLLSRTMKNNGINFPFAGVFGIFYTEKSKNNIDYYIGSLNPAIKSDIPNFTKLYNVTYLKGNFEEAFFDFFEKYYVRNFDSTVLPFLNKYLNEGLEYEKFSNL